MTQPLSIFYHDRPMVVLTALLLFVGVIGCGKTKSQTATEQLLTSNAVDRVIAEIDFSALENQKVYFDDQYIKNIKGIGFVNSEYIISSLRQQIMAAGCRLQDRPDDAEYIIEARCGTLGSDLHEVNFGIPANNLLNTASSIVPTAPSVPSIPEISLAKKEHHIGAAKIGVFAYHKQTKEPVWQAGVKSGRSRSKETWFLGIGPYQSGTIYDEPLFAGAKLKRPIKKLLLGSGNQKSNLNVPDVDYNQDHMFPLAYQIKSEQLKTGESGSSLQWAAHEQRQQELQEMIEQLRAEQEVLDQKAKP